MLLWGIRKTRCATLFFFLSLFQPTTFQGELPLSISEKHLMRQRDLYKCRSLFDFWGPGGTNVEASAWVVKWKQILYLNGTIHWNGADGRIGEILQQRPSADCESTAGAGQHSSQLANAPSCLKQNTRHQEIINSVFTHTQHTAHTDTIVYNNSQTGFDNHQSTYHALTRGSEMARQGHVNIQRGCLSTTRQQFSYIDVNPRPVCIHFVVFGFEFFK